MNQVFRHPNRPIPHAKFAARNEPDIADDDLPLRAPTNIRTVYDRQWFEENAYALTEEDEQNIAAHFSARHPHTIRPRYTTRTQETPTMQYDDHTLATAGHDVWITEPIYQRTAADDRARALFWCVVFPMYLAGLGIIGWALWQAIAKVVG